MRQSPFWSGVETVTNNVAGFILAMAVQAWLLPIFGFHPSLTENVEITSIFMLVSIIRSYFFRRFFDWLNARQDHCSDGFENPLA